ncbi:MAG: hypothetical protein ACRDT4_23155 [Micromonosporaceae bacterium]
MTKKITVSLPDDVAERLEYERNASAYVAEAIRRRMLSEQVREQLRAVGINVTDEDIAKVDEEMKRLEASITPEMRREMVRKVEALKADITAHRS